MAQDYSFSIEKPFLVHVYKPDTVVGHEFTDKLRALTFARRQFRSDDVYKVKVWDIRLGQPVAGVQIHPALILHLV